VTASDYQAFQFPSLRIIPTWGMAVDEINAQLSTTSALDAYQIAKLIP